MKGERKLLTAKFYGTEKNKMTISSKEELDAIVKEVENADYSVADIKKDVYKRQILLVLVVIFIVLKGADIESVWNAMKNADPKWLTAGLGLAAVFNIAEGINLRKVLVSFGYRVSFKEAMKYAYIGYFFSSVTPSATGGQPLQLYAMSKDKIHVAHGTMALLTELTSFQIAASVSYTHLDVYKRQSIHRPVSLCIQETLK